MLLGRLVFLACCVPALAFSVPAANASGAENTPVEAICVTPAELCELEEARHSSTSEWESGGEIDQDSALVSTPKQTSNDNAPSQSKKSQETASGAGNAKATGFVKFAKYKWPSDFVKRWPEQKRLFESLPRPYSPEQSHELDKNYYPFAAAGQLFDKLGKEEFGRQFAHGSVKDLKWVTTAVVKERKAAEEEREIAGGVEKAKDGDSGIVTFTRLKSPKDFVRDWPEQKRLFESIPHPYSPEQTSTLNFRYYPFAAAGLLLEELGEEAFLQKFGEGSVERMRKDAAAVIQQRRAAGKELKIAVAVEEAKDSNSGTVTFTRPKTPKDFVKLWPEQKRLFKSLPLARTPEQKRELLHGYYKFSKAGQLLEEFGEEAFLQKFGGGSIKKMLQITLAETKQRKAAGDECDVVGTVEEMVDVTASEIVRFRRPKTPKDFTRLWPKQKRLFKSLSHPLSPEQVRELAHTYYEFTTAGQLLEELGEEAFLQNLMGALCTRCGKVQWAR